MHVFSTDHPFHLGDIMTNRRITLRPVPILVVLTILSCLAIALPAFADSPSIVKGGLGCDGKEIKVDADLSKRTLADFKVEMRSILASRYHKKCSRVYVERLSTEVAQSWLEQIDASPEAYQYFYNELDPKLNPSSAPFAIFVDGLAYPILQIHQDNKIPILLDFNKIGKRVANEDSDDEPRCPRPCVDEMGEDNGKGCRCTHVKICEGVCGGVCDLCWSDQPMHGSLCYTVKDGDDKVLLSQIPVGATFPL